MKSPSPSVGAGPMNRGASTDRLSRVAAFGVVGAAGFAADAGAMLALSHALAVSALWVRPFSFGFAVTITWWLNRRFTFSQVRSASPAAEWRRYIATNAAGAALNLAIFYLAPLAVPALAERPLLNLALASGLVMVLNYHLAQRLVFRGGVVPTEVDKPGRGLP